MCNINLNPTATAKTVNKAFAKASAQSAKYTLSFHRTEADGNTPVFVTNKETGAEYIVETHEIFSEAIWCNCPEFGHSKFCKHCALVVDEVQIREKEAIYSSIDGNVPEIKF